MEVDVVWSLPSPVPTLQYIFGSKSCQLGIGRPQDTLCLTVGKGVVHHGFEPTQSFAQRLDPVSVLRLRQFRRVLWLIPCLPEGVGRSPQSTDQSAGDNSGVVLSPSALYLAP